MRCHILLPGHDVTVKDMESGGCLLEQAHFGPHLNLTTVNGYILWQADLECTDCDDECECFVWHEISDDEARGLMKVK